MIKLYSSATLQSSPLGMRTLNLLYTQRHVLHEGLNLNFFASTQTLSKLWRDGGGLILISVEYLPMSWGSGILLLMRTDVEDKYHYQADQAGKQDSNKLWWIK